MTDEDLFAPLASLWHETELAQAKLVNHSENHTFAVDGPMGRYSLRVHRQGYQSRPTIESELAWLSALRTETGLPVVEVVPGKDGRHLQTGVGRYAVLFHHVSGREPQIDEPLEPMFRKLGEYAARMHRHVEGWSRPTGFTRQIWNAGHILDPAGLWGDWRVAPGVDSAISDVLKRADAELRSRLAKYGMSSDRFGLVHADMRLGNLLADGDNLTLIDFDDCGFCWFVYDFAASVSFHETHHTVPALRAAWLDGYQTVRPLCRQDVAMLDTMVLLRRMLLLAWIGSHNETPLAQKHEMGFASGTAELAERFLTT
jgi:Ser/Thr protein kinase RdoA (MazF antagonist)